MEEDSIRTLDLTDIMVSPYKPSSGTATFKGTKGDEIPTRFGLSGRATGVKGGELVVSPDGDGGKEESNREVVLKLSWGEVGRNREKVIIDKAREAFQGKEFAEGGDPCDYLPEILGEKVFEDFDTDIVRKAILEDYEAYRAKRPFARRYPVLVMLPKYEPIRVITSMHAATQVSLFIALIYCHAMLWSVGVEHGDISESNLMYEESTGRPKLCDYDLSHIRGDYRPSEHLNPGTWAFMAGDLLTAEAMEGKVTRLYRHDFESFLAVLVWISLRYNNGERVPCPRLDGWAQGDFRRCYAYREDTYTSISFGHFDCPDWLSSDMWYGIEMLVHDFKRILTTRDIAKGKVREKERMKSKSEESLAGKAQTPEAPKKVDFLPDRGLLSNEGFFFRPRGGASVAVPVETPVWKEEDEESLAALKKDVESYDDVRFVNKAASMMELFKFNRSIGPYFTTLLQDNLKVADVSA
ncbi:hypothetical protein DFP72DRAFT_868702 [Ephemerocybe angulata]|uniref:Fungal-type protein kinase domain-containing protein n=1 Tax=Ephemerocybe angulata TaxID=980116 RepID=A0A8H6IHQ3_9AGAR|nr:hypothetical protein DFP72DRAFT_868702 [Tulosesus angulatus]